MGLLTQIKTDLTTSVARTIEPVDAHYHLEVTGLLLGVFDTLSGGSMEVTVIEHNVTYESGESTTLLIPGPTSFAPISLSRGYGNSMELHNWFVMASSGNIVQARRSGSIMLRGWVDGEYRDLVRWDLSNAWPTKIAGFGMNQYRGTRSAKLSLTIVAETINRVDVI